MADISSVSAVINNGEVVNQDNKNVSNAPKGYDKDSFLKILVAQMKYQDPMEPTSNTEYISQYATFTQVEQLSNMANSMALSRASELVGKTVKISQTSADTGKTSEVIGVVDFVSYSGNKAYLNIDGVNYDIEDVTEVYDTEYTNAMAVVEDFQKAIDKLPSLEEINENDHGEIIDSMYKFYMETMTEREKAMMNPNYVTALKQYVNRMDDIRGDDYRTFK